VWTDSQKWLKSVFQGQSKVVSHIGNQHRYGKPIGRCFCTMAGTAAELGPKILVTPSLKDFHVRCNAVYCNDGWVTQ